MTLIVFPNYGEKTNGKYVTSRYMLHIKLCAFKNSVYTEKKFLLLKSFPFIFLCILIILIKSNHVIRLLAISRRPMHNAITGQTQ